MVVGGRPELTDEFQDTITNPKIIAENVSPSTVNRDYGLKLRLYRDLPSLSEYILIKQNQPKVEVFRRVQGADWLLSSYIGLDVTVPVKCLDINLAMSELYEGVEFPAEQVGS